jgi:DNA replication protein DnaC
MAMTETKPAPTECDSCGKKVPPTHMPAVVMGGRVVFTARWMSFNRCDECEKKAIAADEKRANEESWRQRLSASGLNESYIKSLSLDTFKTDNEARERVARVLRPVYSALAKAGHLDNLFLFGHAGTGKTYVASCFCKMALLKNKSVLFRPVPELMMKIRQDTLANRQIQTINHLCDHDVLCLDDLGSEKATEWVIETLYVLIDKWYRNGKKGIIVTSNMPLEGIGTTYGDRIASRIAGMCKVVDFEGCPDGRIE